MKSIKKTTQDFIGTTNNAIKSGLNPLLLHLNQKWRLQGRKRLLNKWAFKNPKLFFASFLIIMVVIISGNFVIPAFINNKAKNERPLSNIARVDDVFNGMREIENNRENIKLYFAKIIENGQNLNNQLDSINQIERKTHNDSVKMKKIITQLNVISNILSHEEN